MTRARIAIALVAVDLVIIATGLTFVLLTSESSTEAAVEVVIRVLSIPFCVFGVLIVRRDQTNRVGWVFLWIGTTFAVNDAALGYASYAIENGMVGRDLAAWISGWVWLPGIAGIGALLLWFPTGRALTRKWALLAWTGATGMVVSTVANAFYLRPLDGLDSFENPYGVRGTGASIVDVGLSVGSILLFFSMLLAGVSLVVRLKRSRGDERQQLKAFTFAAALLTVSLFGTASTFREGAEITAIVLFFQTMTILSVMFLVAAAGLAILKYRLYDIDVVINRALVYTALTFVLAGTYVGFVFALQFLLSPVTADSDLAVAASTLAVAALFRPVRIRVQDFIDRRFYRRRFDAQRTLEEFSTQLRDEVDLSALSHRLTSVVAQTMQPSHLSLWIREVSG